MISYDEVVSWLQIINTDKIGPIAFNKLLKQHESANNVIDALSQKYTIFSYEEAKAEYEKALGLGIEVIIKTDKRYPQKLLEIEDAPPVIYALGNTDLLNHPYSIAIVGTRNATINGRKLTSKIAHDLTADNVLVISGMARGIDTSAHKGAMYAKGQNGPTIAVLGTGIDEVYPAENKELYEQIAKQGLIISEMPLGTTAKIQNFPRRNRIVSGLSQGVLVVEATNHSGSLITAKQAVGQGKMLFAIPGSPNDARASGPNLLLKNGAKLVESAGDIIKYIKNDLYAQLPLSDTDTAKLFLKSLDNSEKSVDIPAIRDSRSMHVSDYITVQATDIDEIIRASGLDTAEVSMQLVELELEDKIIRLPGNKIALNGKKVKVKR